MDGKKSAQQGSKQKGGEGDVGALTGKILKALAQDHRFFAELLDLFTEEGYGRIARAIGVLNERDKISQDGEGKYQIKAP